MIPANPFAPAPFRPALNVGCLFDIQTGRYHVGKHGQHILNGGLFNFTGFAGRTKTFKSAVSLFMILQVLNRYLGTTGQMYETEGTGSIDRVHDLARRMERIAGLDLQELNRYIVCNATQYTGTQWWDLLKDYLKKRTENAKELTVTTPFLERDGSFVKILAPYVPFVDSLSMFAADVVLTMHNKGGIGDSDRNMEFMRDAASKTQLIMEIPTIAGKNSMYIIMTAHVGDKQQIDTYKPNPKKMVFMKADITLKNTPEKFTYLPNNCYYVTAATPMVHADSKTVEFPRNSDDDLKGDTDLMALTIINLRGNAGPSGLPFEIVVSQSEGVLEGLTNFLYIKTYNRFGIGGNLQNFFLDLLPEVSLSRTKIRGKLDADAKLRRACEITSEMCQMDNLWGNDKYPEELRCTPKQLYEELKAKGYDWDLLLNTRGYWVFEEDKHPLNFLSTMDLLKMRVGQYIPYWYDKGKIK
jgi:hypothetical protein